MSYTNDDINKAGELFFHLLNNKILSNNDLLANEFYEDDNIRAILEISKLENYIVINNAQKRIEDNDLKKLLGGILNE